MQIKRYWAIFNLFFCVIQDGKLTADEFVMSHEFFAGSMATEFGKTFHDEFWIAEKEELFVNNETAKK